MRKKISFIIIGSAVCPIKEVTASRGFLCFLVSLTAVFILCAGFILFDYCQLKNLAMANKTLETKISDQLKQITEHRRKIQDYAKEINMLKSELVSLNLFEKKVRIIADIEEKDDEEKLFGMGGSIPEDINTRIDLNKRHNSLLREMHAQVEQLNLASINQKEGFESLLEYLEDQRDLLASTPSIRPAAGWISSNFGYRKSPFTGQREFHRGLDIACRQGTPIFASADGIVTFAGNKGLMGKMIVIDHGHGLITRYAHAHKLLKKKGDVVKRRDTIALVGNTGRSTGPHVHYEVRLNGVPVNPKKYILN
ncbi:MAG: peptidoglycan DD-metalloendopeptidase family protein [Desulfobacterales bacterium]|nr:peptidoglycan DD-metalloendopeptidase family protein [Desulfobacterales bacterium]